MIVNIDNDVVLNILMERVNYWIDDPTTLELFEKMYQNYIEDGAFENIKFDTKEIVDNDYVNYCTIIDDTDENFNKILELAKKRRMGYKRI